LIIFGKNQSAKAVFLPRVSATMDEYGYPVWLSCAQEHLN